MSSPFKQENQSSPTGPKILLTDTNRWPLGPRLAMGFASMGCELAVICPSPRHPASKTSAVRQTLPYVGAQPLASLRRAIEAFEPDIILPLCDRSVQHLHELYAVETAHGRVESRITSLIEYSLGDPESFQFVSSRYQLLQVARAEGIRAPDMIAIDSAAELELWCAQTQPPWVIKADGSWGGRGVRIAKTVREARRDWFELSQRPGLVELVKRLSLNRDRGWILSDWRRARPRVIVQSHIHGRPANCAVVSWKGKVLAGIAVEVIQAQGPTEPAMVVEVVEGSEMLRAAEVLTKHLNLSGFFGLDFMIEEGTGLPYLIEMNPRCTPPCPVPLGSGRDLAAALLAKVTGGVLKERPAATDKSKITYFPANWGNSLLRPEMIDTHTTYYDIPDGEPGLVEELLNPWSARSYLGQAVDFVRRIATRPKVTEAHIFERQAAPAGYDSSSIVRK
jgi:hypothetical protein